MMFVTVEIMFLYLLVLVIACCSLCHKLKGKYERDISLETSVLDTGPEPLGLFLGNSLKYLPVQRKHYHFKIHHHYHNKEDVLKEIHVLPRDITLCEGDPGSFCPNGTWALCTKNGAIRCISSLWTTEMCDKGQFQHCAEVVLPCSFYTPECRNGSRFVVEKSFIVKVPCISILKMYANLIYVNGTVIAQDLIKIYPPEPFCVTVLALPVKMTKGEELFNEVSDMFGEFAIKVLVK